MIGLHVLPMRKAAGAIRSLRLLPGPDQPYHPLAGRVQALLDLKLKAEREQARDEALQAAALAFRNAVEPLAAHQQANLEQVAALAVELGLEVARQVVGDAADRGRVDLRPVVTDCLQRAVLAPGESQVVVRVHPEDRELLVDALGVSGELAHGPLPCRFEADGDQPRGSVQVATGVGCLTMDPRDVVQRVAAAVREELAADHGAPVEGPVAADPGQPHAVPPGAAPPGAPPPEAMPTDPVSERPMPEDPMPEDPMPPEAPR